MFTTDYIHCRSTLKDVSVLVSPTSRPDIYLTLRNVDCVVDDGVVGEGDNGLMGNCVVGVGWW